MRHRSRGFFRRRPRRSNGLWKGELLKKLNVFTVPSAFNRVQSRLKKYIFITGKSHAAPANEKVNNKRKGLTSEQENLKKGVRSFLSIGEVSIRLVPFIPCTRPR